MESALLPQPRENSFSLTEVVFVIVEARLDVAGERSFEAAPIFTLRPLAAQL